MIHQLHCFPHGRKKKKKLVCTYVCRFPDVVSALLVADDVLRFAPAATEWHAARLAGPYCPRRAVEVRVTVPVTRTFHAATLQLMNKSSLYLNIPSLIYHYLITLKSLSLKVPSRYYLHNILY